MQNPKVGKIIKKINSKITPPTTTFSEDTTHENNNNTNLNKIENASEKTNIVPAKRNIMDILTQHNNYHTLESFRKFAEHLKYSPLEAVSVNYKHLIISNSLLGDIQTLILKLPKLRIRSIYQINQKIKLSTPIKLSIYTGVPDNNKLLTFLTRLENEVTRKIRTITGNKQLQLSSCITKFTDYYPDFKVNAPFTKLGNCVEFSFEIFGRYNRRVNFESLVKGIQISCYIELDHVWVGENNFGLSWIIKRAKVYPEKIWNSSNVFDSDDEEDEKEEDNIKPKECYHCMYCPNNHVRTHCCLGLQNNYGENVSQQYGTSILPFSHSIIPTNSSISLAPLAPLAPPPPPPFIKNLAQNVEDKPNFVPTLSDLLAGKSKLRSVSVIVKNKSEEKINNNVNCDNNNNDNDNFDVNNLSNIKKNLKTL